MNTDDLIDIGFEPISSFTIMNSFIYKLGRYKHISISNIGTTNEMVWICVRNAQNEKEITDAICIHNYDYDGFLTENKLKTIINVIVGT